MWESGVLGFRAGGVEVKRFLNDFGGEAFAEFLVQSEGLEAGIGSGSWYRAISLLMGRGFWVQRKILTRKFRVDHTWGLPSVRVPDLSPRLGDVRTRDALW